MKTQAAWLCWCLPLLLISMGCQAASVHSNDKQPEWVAGSNMLHPPFSSWDANEKAVGLEVDIVESAAASLGASVRWVELPFAELLPAVAAGKIDIAVSTIGITDDRSQHVAFSDPYFSTEIVALVKPNSNFETLDDLLGRRIGADRATTSFVAAKRAWPANPIVGAAQEGTGWVRMVHAGTIDAFVVDASDEIRLERLAGMDLRRLEEPLAKERFGVVLQHGARKKLAALNQSIATLSEVETSAEPR